MIHRLPNQIGYILHERAPLFYGAGAGFLSIKAFFHGRALYSAGAGHYAADDSGYLLLNHGQPYSITIESETPVESFCVFFAPGFAAEARRAIASPDEALLLEPTRADDCPPAFYERTYRHDELVSPLLLRLRRALAEGEPDPAWLAEQAHGLIERLLLARAGVAREIAAVPAARAATREELYRRLHLARDYAEALLPGPVALDDMARAAALSPNHLLRTFRQVFGQTPHQYLAERRIERACRLLRETDQPITTICYAVGFESPGSFSWAFRRRVGVPPLAYRRQTR